MESYQIDEEVSDEEYDNRLQVLKYGLEQNFNFSTQSIPEEVIDAFVKEIIVYPYCFVWKLNITNDGIKLQVEGRKTNPTVSLIESPTDGNSSSSYNSFPTIKSLEVIVMITSFFIEFSCKVVYSSNRKQRKSGWKNKHLNYF